MAHQEPKLARYLQLLHDLIGDSDEANALRGRNKSKEGRSTTCNDRRVPAEERGDLGYEYVQYNVDDNIDILILQLIQYICMELRGQAYLGEPRRGECKSLNTTLFELLTGITQTDSATGEEFRRIMEGTEEERRRDIPPFLSRYLADDMRGFQEPLQTFLLEGQAQDFASEFYTFCRDYADEFIIPC